MIAVITFGMLVALGVASVAASRGPLGARFVGVQLAAVIAVQLAVVLSIRAEITYYADVALLMAIVAVVAGLLFARFLERWL